MKLLTGDSRDKLKELEDNSIDALVTDPPYLINFMGKDWDKENSPAADATFWEEVLRVMKPGAHGLVFGHSRQHHRVMTALEDAGFEIRDCLMWLYGSGFPKSHNIGKAVDKLQGNQREVVGETKAGKTALGQNSGWNNHNNITEIPVTKGTSQWEGWGTALKPAYEPIILIRKPVEKKLTIAKNVLKHGTGGLNIDASRIGTDEDFSSVKPRKMMSNQGSVKTDDHDHTASDTWQAAKDKLQNLGRFPANVLLDEVSAQILDEQAPAVGNAFKKTRTKDTSGGTGDSWKTNGKKAGQDNGVYDGLSGASRFFYCAKVSKSERNAGCDGLEIKEHPSVDFRPNHKVKADEGHEGTPFSRFKPERNNHPTVKPIKLMTYLTKLITPPNGLVLDPFMGSGSTGMACALEGFDFVGIEMDPDYAQICEARIQWAREEKKKSE
jgi:site-specific DNA-methyltransferase (adenine-specific)